MVDFTKEELFVIERDADLNSGIASRNIHLLTDKFLLLRGVENKQEGNKELHEELLNLMMMTLQEHHRAVDIYKGIRDKCEKERKE